MFKTRTLRPMTLREQFNTAPRSGLVRESRGLSRGTVRTTRPRLKISRWSWLVGKIFGSSADLWSNHDMWTKLDTSSHPRRSRNRRAETLHLQTCLFGGADVVRQSRGTSRVTSYSVVAFESVELAERHVDHVLQSEDFKRMGESS